MNLERKLNLDTMDPRLDPEMVAVLRKRLELTGERQQSETFSLIEERIAGEKGIEFWNEGGPDLAHCEDRMITGPYRQIPVRFYRPTDTHNLPVIVYLHGGGWVLGSVRKYDRLIRHLAVESKAVVVGVSYALAPEHPYPAALNEATAVIDWISKSGSAFGIDSDQIAIAGDSAGANVALGALLKMRDDGSKPLRGAAFLYGVFRSDLNSRSYDEFGDGRFGLAREGMRNYLDLYVPDRRERNSPYVAPLLADLAGLPPVHLCAAQLDVLRDDSVDLATRLREARIPFELEIVEGVVHGFARYPRILSKARHSVAAAAHFLAGTLDGAVEQPTA